MRILNLIHSLDPALGGPAAGLRHSALASRELGHDEQVLTLDGPGAPWLAGWPAPVHALGPRRGHWGWSPRVRPWLREHGRSFDAAVVHGLWQFPGVAAWTGLQGVPYFVFPHGMLDPWFKHSQPVKHLKKRLYWQLLEKRVLRGAQALLFTSAEEARLAPQSFGVLPTRAEVVGYGIALAADAQGAQAAQFLDEHPALRGRRLLLFLGRLHPKKGCGMLLAALAAVAAQEPDLHLVMAGPADASYGAGLLALTQQLGISERVTFTGMLQGDAKWAALRAAEAFVLPSHQENFGVAVAEALAMGVPVLISDQVNIWREVAAAGAGLVAPDTPVGTEALLRAWLGLDPQARRAMQAAGQTCFERHFHIRSTVQRLLQVLAASPLPPASRLAESQP